MNNNFEFNTFDELLKLYNDKIISQRQFIIYSKSKFKDIIFTKTQFLDPYNADILERLFCIVNGISTIKKCKYCDNKAIWTGRFNEGYLEICNSTNCRSKQLSDNHAKKNEISVNRDSQFILAQSHINEVNDDIIINLIKYDKYLELIDNQLILEYLDTRYSDSYSRLETLQRIRMHVEEKPICPICGSPVKFIGRKRAMFSIYCSDKCSANSKLTISKRKATLLEKWGSENCYDSEQYKQQMKEKYGVEYHWQREDVKEKRKNTLIEHFGTIYPTSLEEIKSKVWETTKLHSLCTTSHEENNLFEYLKNNMFPDIIRFYKSEKYHYNCDYYIPSLDLYIEYQGSFFHNGRAYLNTSEDIEEVKRIEQKLQNRENEIKKPTKYEALIKTWCFADVKKRNIAKESKLNFLEIFRFSNYEFVKNQITFYLACKQQNNAYEYLLPNLQNEYTYYKNLITTELDNFPYLKFKIIKYFQCQNFYSEEMRLYAEDPVIRRRIIQNRMKYLNKDEEDLTPDDILSSFKKSGLYYGYSHFNPCLTNWFVHQYNIKTIYEPCGGWGHHILGELSCEKIIYNDFSEPIVKGIEKMKQCFNISQLDVHYGDARTFIPEDVDGFFMCPPYYNIEKYFCDEFKDIQEYKDFLNNIFDIWLNNSAKIFGLVIREDLIQYIPRIPDEEYFIDKNKISYLSGGEKKNLEKFYIFKK